MGGYSDTKYMLGYCSDTRATLLLYYNIVVTSGY